MIQCSYCGKSLTEKRGRSKARAYCCGDAACRRVKNRMKARNRAQKFKAQGLNCRGRQIKTQRQAKTLVSQRQITIMSNRQWLRDEMFKRGKCAYHYDYFGEELIVNDAYIEVFEFDHIDRTKKRGRNFMVSRLVVRAPLHVVQAEVALCELVCSNCHQIKTRRNEDWRQSRGQIHHHPQLNFE